MSTPLIIQVPADTTATQWDQIHRALNEHRAAFPTGADIAANFPTASAVPTVVQPPAATSVPSLLDTLTAPSAPAVPPPPPVPVQVPEPTGDPLWLGRHISDHNALPESSDENWHHILADTSVRDATKGTGHEAAVKKLRQQASAAKARWVKSHKPGNGAAQSTAPASQSMTSLSDLLGGQTATTAPQVTPEAVPDVVLNNPAQLTDAQRQAIWTWASQTLVDPRKQACAVAWLNGDVNPATNKPITLDDIEAAGIDVARKIRRKVKA